MSDPKRLLDELKLSDAERRALSAGQDIEPPAGMHGDVWQTLAAKLPPAPFDPSGGGGAVGGGLSGAGAASAGLSAMIFKAVGVGALLGGIAMGGKYVSERAFTDTPPRAAKTVSRSVPAAPPVQDSTPSTPEATPPTVEQETDHGARSAPASPSAMKSSPQPTSEPQAPTAPRTSGSIAAFADTSDTRDRELNDATARRTASQEESSLIASARSELRAGSASRALNLLDSARRRFPSGILTQEREALTVEALLRTGQRDAANARTEAFLRAYPKSPHVARVKALMSAP